MEQKRIPLEIVLFRDSDVERYLCTGWRGGTLRWESFGDR